MAKRKPKQVLVTWIDPTALGGIDAKATITQAGVMVASRMARAGHPMRGIAATMGLGAKAFKGATDRQPELQRAMDTSLGDLEQECVDVLLKAMREGAFVPAIFMLKAKFFWREQMTPTDQRVQINLQIPPGMSQAEAAKLIRDISPVEPPAIDAEFEELPAPKKVIR